MNSNSLDTSKIHKLTDDMGSRAAAYAFLAKFLDQIPNRVKKISEALHHSDDETAVKWILSLKVSASMSGGQEVEQRCSNMERAILGGHRDYVHSQIPALKQEASVLTGALETLLTSSGPGDDWSPNPKASTVCNAGHNWK